MMGDPPAKEYNTYMMQVSILLPLNLVMMMKIMSILLKKKRRRRQFKFLQEGQPQNGSGQYAQVSQKNISFQRILLETILLIFHTRTPAIPLISLLVPTG